MTIRQVPYNFTPRDFQLELFVAMDGIKGRPETKKKLALLRWHRRAGKDKACWAYMCKEAATTPGNYQYIFPTKADAERSLWRNVDKNGFRTLDHLPKEYIKRILDDKMLIELHNGSTIQVTGYDLKVESTRGQSLKGAVFSEWAFSDPTVLRRLRPSIVETGGWVIINSTPDGMNHFHAMERAAKGSPEWFVSIQQTLWPDKPYYSGLLTPEQIQIEADFMGYTREEIEREYGVSYNTTSSGAYYAAQLDELEARGQIAPNMYTPSLPVYTYWDIGLSDYQVLWFAQKHGDKTIFIDYHETSGTGTDAMAQMLKEKGYYYLLHVLPHDGMNRQHGRTVKTTEQSLRESLADFDVSGTVMVNKKTPNINASIAEVRKKFFSYSFDSVTCKEGLDHLYKYSKLWDKRLKTFIDAHKHDQHSHAADAFRMEAESTAKTQNKTGKAKVFKASDFGIF